MRLHPAAENTGIRFRRTDLQGKNEINADFRLVGATRLGTTLKDGDVSIATVEHLMAALWGCGIDNALIEVDGPEVPIMDGSSEPFVFLLECAGKREQQAARKVIQVLKPIEVSENGATARITPGEGFTVGMEIRFPHAAIAEQKITYEIDGACFKKNLARARTFGFAEEVEQMRAAGLARGGSLENAIVIGPDKVLNAEGLRYTDEFVRHKVLDCVGDLFLAGAHIQGSVEGFRSGHGLNNKLLRALMADNTAWRMTGEKALAPLEAA